MLPAWLVSDLLVVLVFVLGVGLGRKAAKAWHVESLQKEGYQEASEPLTQNGVLAITLYC